MAAAKKNITVLVVDDEKDILELIEDEFKYQGYDTLTATCGNDAVEILKKNEVQVVVSDFKMPNGNGMSVLAHVSQMAKKPFFFFVSGQADVSSDAAIKAGATKFFSKPFDLEELIKEIEQLIVV
jgi:DNA-binding NtrC family response regulator